MDFPYTNRASRGEAVRLGGPTPPLPGLPPRLCAGGARSERRPLSCVQRPRPCTPELPRPWPSRAAARALECAAHALAWLVQLVLQASRARLPLPIGRVVLDAPETQRCLGGAMIVGKAAQSRSSTFSRMSRRAQPHARWARAHGRAHGACARTSMRIGRHTRFHRIRIAFRNRNRRAAATIPSSYFKVWARRATTKTTCPCCLVSKSWLSISRTAPVGHSTMHTYSIQPSCAGGGEAVG